MRTLIFFILKFVKTGIFRYYSIYVCGGEMKLKMILPKNVSYIISKLEQAGYEAYAVGDVSGILFWGENRRTGISPLLPNRFRLNSFLRKR